MKKGKVSGTLVCLLVVALVLALYYAAVFIPLSKSTALLAAEHEQASQQLSAYETMALNKSTVEKSVSDLQAKVQSAGSQLGIPAAGLSNDIAAALGTAGITATSITMSDAQAGSKTPSGHVVTTVSITIGFDATEPQLTALLHYFERGTSAVYYVNSVGMTAKNQQGVPSAGLYTVSLNITAYYLQSTSPKAAS